MVGDNLGALPPRSAATGTHIPEVVVQWAFAGGLSRVTALGYACPIRWIVASTLVTARLRSNASIPPSRCVFPVSPDFSTSVWRGPPQPKRSRGTSFEGHSGLAGCYGALESNTVRSWVIDDGATVDDAPVPMNVLHMRKTSLAGSR